MGSFDLYRPHYCGNDRNTKDNDAGPDTPERVKTVAAAGPKGHSSGRPYLDPCPHPALGRMEYVSGPSSAYTVQGGDTIDNTQHTTGSSSSSHAMALKVGCNNISWPIENLFKGCYYFRRLKRLPKSRTFHIIFKSQQDVSSYSRTTGYPFRAPIDIDANYAVPYNLHSLQQLSCTVLFTAVSARITPFAGRLTPERLCVTSWSVASLTPSDNGSG
ncbi:hypothetical protein J6590_047966 [Homalodisca vitripennis]|nr:hypothetical protein J6590_047966 [Homalodisca vitripennis]